MLLKSSNCGKIGRRIIVDAKSCPLPNVQIISNLWHEIPLHTDMIQQQPFQSSIAIPGAKHVPLDPNNRPNYQAFHNNFAMGVGGFPGVSGPPPPPPRVSRRGKVRQRYVALGPPPPLQSEIKSESPRWCLETIN